MSGELHPPAGAAPAPGLDASQTASLLERLIHEQVLACVDLDELCSLEQSIALLAGELPGVGHDRAAELARAMLDRALQRLPDDVRRYLRAASAAFDDCELCQAEARQAARSSGGGGGAGSGAGGRPTRARS